MVSFQVKTERFEHCIDIQSLWLMFTSLNRPFACPLKLSSLLQVFPLNHSLFKLGFWVKMIDRGASQQTFLNEEINN